MARFRSNGVPWSLLAFGVLVGSAVACGHSDSGRDDAGCSYASCSEACAVDALCYGSCTGGTCQCSSCGSDGDADAGDDIAAEVDGSGDGGDDAGGDVPDVEAREGGSPGILCRHVPTGSHEMYGTASGSQSLVAFPQVVEGPSGRAWVMQAYDWSARSLRTVDDLADVPTASTASRISYWPSLDGDWIAYGVVGHTAIDRRVVQVRIANLGSGERRILASGSGDVDHTESIGQVVLRYPWVVWRQVSEETYWYAWTAWYMNLETGVKAEIIPREPGVVNLDLLETTAVVSVGATIFAVDVAGGTTSDLAPDDAEQWAGVITPSWIAWLDQSEHPSGTWFHPYGTDVYGQNRATGEIVPLVNSPGMHGPELNGEGDWLAYTDQRDNANPWEQVTRSENIYALYLPTMSEICVEDWPGYEIAPKVYQGVDGMRVLFFEELGAPGSYNLWDCNLPTP
jgi:hypothetical protein